MNVYVWLSVVAGHQSSVHTHELSGRFVLGC